MSSLSPPHPNNKPCTRLLLRVHAPSKPFPKMASPLPVPYFLIVVPFPLYIFVSKSLSCCRVLLSRLCLSVLLSVILVSVPVLLFFSFVSVCSSLCFPVCLCVDVICLIYALLFSMQTVFCLINVKVLWRVSDSYGGRYECYWKVLA